jgi:Major Facilitator Superfamily
MTEKSPAMRTLVLASLAHALHDGFTDMIYVLLPVWQAEFALDYVALAVLRALYVGVLAVLQVPSAHLARQLNARTVLVLGTLLGAAGYALAGLSGGLVGLCASLALAGARGSTQHPLASAAVSRAYGERARGPLGTYNFADDLGKATLPPALSLLLTVMGWRSALWVAAGFGALVAVLIRWLMPLVPAPPAALETEIAPDHEAAGKGGFGLLFAIGMLDTAARMGFLLFLPFLLKAKGAFADQGRVGLVAGLYRRSVRKSRMRLAWRSSWPARNRRNDRGWHCGSHPGRARLASRTNPGSTAFPGCDAQRHVLRTLRYSSGSYDAETNRASLRSFLYGHLRIKRAGTRSLRTAWRCRGTDLGHGCGGPDGRRCGAAHAPAVTTIGPVTVRRWLSLPVVFKVQSKVVVRVRVAGGHIRQELAAAEVGDAATHVEMLIEFIPGVAIDFRAYMAAVVGLVDHDRTARTVVD